MTKKKTKKVWTERQQIQEMMEADRIVVSDRLLSEFFEMVMKLTEDGRYSLRQAYCIAYAAYMEMQAHKILEEENGSGTL